MTKSVPKVSVVNSSIKDDWSQHGLRSRGHLNRILRGTNHY